MYRTHTCGELRLKDVNKEVTLSGWVRKVRDMGGMTFIDLRDRYGITQLVFDMENQPALTESAQKLGREYVIQVKGKVYERSSKNSDLPTGDIEILVQTLNVLSESKLPPFTIEDETDGGEELRMKYRFLDLRRGPLQHALWYRHKTAQEMRSYMNGRDFYEIETPVLIKSTPEGARDFVVPSRIHEGQFYALPQSPQIFKQLLMISGYDRYYQLVKCFRDEDLRADRQPEFTQIDLELSFAEREDVLQEVEGLTKHLFKQVLAKEMNEAFPRMTYQEAMETYGTDRPDLRFGMKLTALTALVTGKGFKVFDSAAYVGGICAPGCANYSRKQLDKLTDFVKKPQVGAKGLVYVKYNEDGSLKSSVDKFFGQEDLKQWAEAFEAKPGDLLLILAGAKTETLYALSELRLKMADDLNLRDSNTFAPLWVLDFPLMEWDEEEQRYAAMHHPFTAPKEEDAHLLETKPEQVKANAYDLVINGVEVAGGSIRIHDSNMQMRMLNALGFSEEQAEAQFGFLMHALQYGAPPHGGCAFGYDRFVALLAGYTSIRDVIPFPKNNAGRDLMMETPSAISEKQLEELHLQVKKSKTRNI